MKPATTVVHVKDGVPGAVYIGRASPRHKLRASPWRNRYRLGKDGNRDEVIQKYKAWLLSDEPEAVQLLARLPELRGKALACWCKEPGKEAPCHGDVLAALADQLDE
jgi:hypothetical protein